MCVWVCVYVHYVLAFYSCLCVFACSTDWAEETECGNIVSPRKSSLDGNTDAGKNDDDGSDDNWDSDDCEYWLVIALPTHSSNVHECVQYK